MGQSVWLDGGPIRYTERIDGVAVLHRIAVEHGWLLPFASNSSSADLAADQLAAVTHPGGASRVIAPAGSGKTRVLTERARHLLTQMATARSSRCAWWRSTSGPRRRSSTRVADLARSAGAHAQRHRTGDRQRRLAVRSTADDDDHDHRARRTPDHRQAGRVSSQAQLRPGGVVDRSAVVGPAAVCAIRTRSRLCTTATSTGSRQCCRGTDTSSAGRVRSTTTNRSCGRSRYCSPMSQPEPPPSGHAGCCSSTSSRTSLRPTSCWCDCWPDRMAACSGSATTTRRSTGSTAPTRSG